MAGMEIILLRQGLQSALFVSTSTAVTDPLWRQHSSFVKRISFLNSDASHFTHDASPGLFTRLRCPVGFVTNQRGLITDDFVQPSTT